ncbi:hypothetical protein LINPERPRIM_LOCUS38197 [Linum perenne]
MVMRRWHLCIKPLDFFKELKPAWVKLRDVLAKLITPEVIS